MWAMLVPFDKYGAPRVATSGKSIRGAVIMEAETFKRMLAEHPSLETAQFRVGTFEESP